MRTSHLILATLVAVAAGCARTSADRAPSRTADEGGHAKQLPAGQEGSTARTTERAPTMSGLMIDPQIIELCEIEVAPESYVDFDADNPDGDPVLTAVSACLVAGPLKDRKVEIVDHADTRTTVQAELVKDYLTGQGIAADNVTMNSASDSGAHPLTASTPAELELVRRVDIVLVPIP